MVETWLATSVRGTRSEVFARSDLAVLENGVCGAGLPSERDVWALAESPGIEPMEVVLDETGEDEEDDEFDLPVAHQVYAHWLRHALRFGVVSREGTFLVSITAPVEGVGWSRVRLGANTLIGGVWGIDFVALSEDGRRFCGAIDPTEFGDQFEGETWIVAGDVPRPPGIVA